MHDKHVTMSIDFVVSVTPDVTEQLLFYEFLSRGVCQSCSFGHTHHFTGSLGPKAGSGLERKRGGIGEGRGRMG